MKSKFGNNKEIRMPQIPDWGVRQKLESLVSVCFAKNGVHVTEDDVKYNL